jgi:hypothetical protein
MPAVFLHDVASPGSPHSQPGPPVLLTQPMRPPLWGALEPVIVGRMSNMTATATASIVATLQYPIPLGWDYVVVYHGIGGGKTAQSVADSAGNPVSLDEWINNGAATTIAICHGRCSVAALTTASTITLTLAGTTPNYSATVYAIPPGVLASQPLDGHQNAQGSTAQITVGPAPTPIRGQNGALVFVGVSWNDASGNTPMTPDMLGHAIEHSNLARGGFAEWIRIPPGGAQPTGKPLLGSAQTWAAVIATYDLAPDPVLLPPLEQQRFPILGARGGKVFGPPILLEQQFDYTVTAATPTITPPLALILRAKQSRQPRRVGIVQPSVALSAAASLPPQPPLSKPLVVTAAPRRRSVTRILRLAGTQPPTTAPPSAVVTKQQPRRQRLGRIISLWPGFAAPQGAAVTPPLPRQQVVTSTPETSGRRPRSRVLAPRWLVTVWAALPPTPPARPSVVVSGVEERPRRFARIVALRGIVTPAPATPAPRPLVVSAPTQRRRAARVVAARVVVAPITLPVRALLVVADAIPLQRRRSRIVQAEVTVPPGVPARGRVIQIGAAVRRRSSRLFTGRVRTSQAPVITIQTRDLYAYPSVGDTAIPGQVEDQATLTGSQIAVYLAPGLGLAPDVTVAPQAGTPIVISPTVAAVQTVASGVPTIGSSGTVTL